MAALEQVAGHYTVEEPHHKRVLNLEMGAEVDAQSAVGGDHRSVDAFLPRQYRAVVRRARDEGKIAHSMDVRTLAQICR